MTRRYATFLRSLAVSLVMALSLTGCPENPYDPQTWIDKLDDPTQVKNAVTQLQRLAKKEAGIHKAIGPLGKVWEKQNRPKKILTVIVEIAEKGKGGPYWDKAIPILQVAVDEFDVGDSKSIENAILAADALGKAGIKDAVPTLVRALSKKMPNKSAGQRVRLAAVAALGKFGKDSRAVGALVQVMKADPDKQPAALFAAAALAMADARSPEAVEPLIVALFKIAPIYSQCRRALIAIGEPARDRLIKVFQKKDPVLNKLAEDNKFNIDCKKGIGTATTCKAPSNLEYKSAMLLGDFYSEVATKPLLKGLDADALPSYFERGIPGPTQHASILNALKLIGDPSAGDRVWKYIADAKTDDGVRPMAVDTYSYLTQKTDKLPELAKRIKDDEADENLRNVSGIAYGRLATKEDQYEPLMYMINRYKKEANKKEKELKKAEAAFEKAKKAWEPVSKEWKAKEAAKKKDKKLKAKFDKLQAAMDKKQQAKSLLEGRVASYRGFQRSFEQNLARAHVFVMCKQDPMCYAGILDKKADDIGGALKKYIKDWKEWSDDEKKNLLTAAIERSLLELRKMGVKGEPATDVLLKKVDTTDGITRQGILLALVKIAKTPCDKCVARLDEVLKEQKDQSTLQRLAVETQAVRGFFLWAGR